ncbi:MAG TPA: radical SAM protein [Smithellaceae bacterium]|nr:radical SAM protein [Smithellaceae bacterium]
MKKNLETTVISSPVSTGSDPGARLPWLLDLADFFFQRKVLNRKIPLLASFKLTYQCNLQCLGCPFHLRASEAAMRMVWRTAVGALDELACRQARIVVFEGGEPLLWRDGKYRLPDLIAYARKRFLRVAVTTNGTYPLDAPADLIWVSLDGTKKTHDELRGASYDRVMENLSATTHPRVFVHCTINRRNVEDLDLLADEVRRMPSVKGMTFQFFYPYHQGEENLTLSSDERRRAVLTLLRLKKDGHRVMNSANRLRAMIENDWRCHDDLLINVDPDGTVTTGCYVKNRGTISCRACGFTPVAEASGALDGVPGSIVAGWKIFMEKGKTNR